MKAQNKGLSLEWSKHLKTEAERKDFEATVRTDTIVLGRLAEILEEKLSGLQSREASPLEYDSPSWAYKQAHLNGYRQGLTTILKLITLS